MTDINPASWVSRMMQKDGAGSSNLKCQVVLDRLRCARSMQAGSLWGGGGLEAEKRIRGHFQNFYCCISLEVATHDAPSFHYMSTLKSLRKVGA